MLANIEITTVEERKRRGHMQDQYPPSIMQTGLLRVFIFFSLGTFQRPERLKKKGL